TLEELVKVFTLERVIKSGARFNPDKAKWFNQEYLRMRPTEKLVAEFRAAEGERVAAFSDEYIGGVLDLMRERVHFPTEFHDATAFFFEAPAEYDPAAVAKFWKDDIPALIPQVRDFIAGLDPFTKEHVGESIEGLIRENGWPMGKVMNTLRLFLVGKSVGPGVAEMMALMGKDEVLRRIDKGIASLK
ncbi:MAG: glutamate--tRNA ligase, partial [Bacteroidales bacterium]